MISVRANFADVGRALKRTISQIPYATAKAINATAVDVQKAEGDNLQKKQVIRTEWWKPGRKLGINIKFAKKDFPEATVGTQADWEKKHEEGGVKTPRGKNISVPTPEQRGGQREVMVKGKRPKAALKDGAFFQKVGGLLGIWKRTGKERLPIRLLFKLTANAKIRKALGFKEVGVATVNKTYNKHFEREYEKALKDFKP